MSVGYQEIYNRLEALLELAPCAHNAATRDQEQFKLDHSTMSHALSILKPVSTICANCGAIAALPV